jgi:hypothetical protein
MAGLVPGNEFEESAARAAGNTSPTSLLNPDSANKTTGRASGRAGAWSAAAVRSREGFVQVEVDDVNTHVPRRGPINSPRSSQTGQGIGNHRRIDNLLLGHRAGEDALGVQGSIGMTLG